MIIGLSGAQGTGKTTLLNFLGESNLVKDYRFRSEVTRWIKSLGVNINEDGDVITQKLIMMSHVFNLHSSGPKMITDRSVLDCLVYSRYLHENDKISDECMDEMIEAFNLNKNFYHKMFYVEPEVALVEDGVRSTSIEFRKRIIELFDEAINNDMNGNVIRIMGTVEERAEMVLGVISGG